MSPVTNDFVISDEELLDLYNSEIKTKNPKISFETFKAVHTENLKELETKYNEFNKKLEAYGIKIYVNSVNDSGHNLNCTTSHGSH